MPHSSKAYHDFDNMSDSLDKGQTVSKDALQEVQLSFALNSGVS